MIDKKLNGHIGTWLLPAVVSLSMTLGTGLVLWGKQDDRIATMSNSLTEKGRELAELHKEQAEQDKVMGVLRADLNNLKERVEGCEKREH